MLTPQDIQNKEFDKAFNGYDRAAVDDFLDAITEDLTALYKENNLLKSKMKVLVDKVEEYRGAEDAIRLALVNAQKTSSEITASAEEKSAAMLKDAEERSAAMLKDAEEKSTAMLLEAQEKTARHLEEAEYKAQAQIAEYVDLTKFENERLEKAALNSRQYIEAARKMAENQLQFLDTLILAAPEPVEVPEYDFISDADDEYEEEPEAPVEEAEEDDDREAKILDTAKAIDENVSNAVGTEPSAPLQNAVKHPKNSGGINWEDDDEPTSPRPKFNFENLQFGSNVDNN